MRNIIIGVSCGVFFSLFCFCINKQEVSSIILPDSKLLYSQSLNIKRNILNPKRMVANNKYLVIFDDVKSDIFKVFDLNSEKILYTWGNTGKGPDDLGFIYPNSIHFNSKDQFIFVEGNFLHTFQITDSTFIRVKKQDLSQLKYAMFDEFLEIHDTIAISYAHNFGLTDNFEFTLIKNYDSEFRFGSYPVFSKLVEFNDDMDKKLYFKSFITHNKAKNEIISFYRNINLIKVLDLSGETKELFQLREKTKNTIDHVYFFNPVYTDRGIFVLLLNESENILAENLDKFQPSILFFEQDLNLITNFKLEYLANIFTVSNDGNILYSLSYNRPDTILKYSLR